MREKKRKALHECYTKVLSIVKRKRTNERTNHFQLRMSLRAEQKVLQFQISVHDVLGMQIPQRGQHLANQPHGILLLVVVVRLFVENVKEFPTLSQLLHQIDARVVLVDLLQARNVGMVQLRHDGDFVAQLLLGQGKGPRRRFLVSLGRHQPIQIEDFDGEGQARRLVCHVAHPARHALPQNVAPVHAVVDFVDGAHRFQIDHVADQVACGFALFQHGFQTDRAGVVGQRFGILGVLVIVGALLPVMGRFLVAVMARRGCVLGATAVGRAGGGQTTGGGGRRLADGAGLLAGGVPRPRPCCSSSSDRIPSRRVSCFPSSEFHNNDGTKTIRERKRCSAWTTEVWCACLFRASWICRGRRKGESECPGAARSLRPDGY